jgi:alpha-L-fucosidase
MKKIAILQSNYIPWKGYFDLIGYVDEFIFFDDMQFTKRDWRNRNLIKTPQGLRWLTVPVQVKGKFHQSIYDTKIDGQNWAADHWKSLTQNYCKAAMFKATASWLEPLYLDNEYKTISELNQKLITAVCQNIGIETRLSQSSDFILASEKSARLAEICEQANAKIYVSGPSAKRYLEAESFSSKGLEITWFDYQGFPEYQQLWGQFEHGVTILDLLFNHGKDARMYLRHTK